MWPATLGYLSQQSKWKMMYEVMSIVGEIHGENDRVKEEGNCKES